MYTHIDILVYHVYPRIFPFFPWFLRSSQIKSDQILASMPFKNGISSVSALLWEMHLLQMSRGKEVQHLISVPLP